MTTTLVNGDVICSKVLVYSGIPCRFDLDSSERIMEGAKETLRDSYTVFLQNTYNLEAEYYLVSASPSSPSGTQTYKIVGIDDMPGMSSIDHFEIHAVRVAALPVG